MRKVFATVVLVGALARCAMSDEITVSASLMRCQHSLYTSAFCGLDFPLYSGGAKPADWAIDSVSFNVSFYPDFAASLLPPDDTLRQHQAAYTDTLGIDQGDNLTVMPVFEAYFPHHVFQVYGSATGTLHDSSTYPYAISGYDDSYETLDFSKPYWINPPNGLFPLYFLDTVQLYEVAAPEVITGATATLDYHVTPEPGTLGSVSLALLLGVRFWKRNRHQC